MIRAVPLKVENNTAIGIEVQLPKTTLLAVTTDIGYIMCGALDIQLLNEKLSDREIIAGRATGVRTLEQLMESPLESVTLAAEKIGIHPGMQGREAIQLMMTVMAEQNMN